MTELRKQYISYMRYRNYSPRTIKNYCSCLIKLSVYYTLSPDNITRKQFIEYLYYLSDVKRASSVYINQIISSTRMQIHICLDKGKKDRYVMLSKKILLLLREYWKKYRPKEYLFEGRIQGKAIPGRTVQHAFQAAVIKSKIKKHACVNYTHLQTLPASVKSPFDYLGV